VKMLSLVTCAIVVSKVFMGVVPLKVYVTVDTIPYFRSIVVDLGDAICGFWFVLVCFGW
jgi:hypothetical protein